MSISTHPSTGTPVALSISANAPNRNPAPSRGLAPPELIPPEKEQQLFNAFFDAQMPLVEIARDFKVSVTTLAAWAAQPHVRERLLQIAEFARLRTRLLAADLSSRAIYTLDCVSSFHQSDLGDSRSTAAISRRRDVARKSAVDTLRIGLRPLDDLFPDPANDRTRNELAAANLAPHRPIASPELQQLLQVPPRPKNAVEHILALTGTSASASSRAAGSVAAATNRPEPPHAPDPLPPHPSSPNPQTLPHTQSTSPREEKPLPANRPP